MGWEAPDVYGNPEKFGLTLIGEVEWYEPCYSFDTTIVLKDADGKLYWGDDSGCSCPSPFENFTSIDKLDTGTADQLRQHLEQRLAEGTTTWPVLDSAKAEVADLMLKVRS